MLVLLLLLMALLFPTTNCVDIITTVAGTGASSFSGDSGAATSATLYNPYGVSLDAAGNLYITDRNNHCVRKVTAATGIISTFAGIGSVCSFNGDGGQATSAYLCSPYNGIVLDSAGNVYFADGGNVRVRKVTVSTGKISTIAGTGGNGWNGDGIQASSAQLNGGYGVALDTSGNVYIADECNYRVRKVTVSTGIITTIAGTGVSGYSGDNGQATSAKLLYPEGVELDSTGNVYISDAGNHVIRKITLSTGIITTIVGTGSTSLTVGDGGPATAATLYYPHGITLDSSGNIYIADRSNYRIRKVTVSTGVITTIVGNGAASTDVGDNGYATAASLNIPTGVSLDSSGNVYIADTNNCRIRKVAVGANVPSYTPTVIPTTATPSLVPSTVPTYSPTSSPSVGIITTVVGTGTASYSGDNGAATSASLNYPIGVTLDSSGNIYIADRMNHRIRKVTAATGIITTIAGTGTSSYSGDNGQATSAALNNPHMLTLDSAGNIYITDTYNNRVRKVTASIITLFAGTGSTSFSGDNGPATSATLSYPVGLAMDVSGNVYIGEFNNHRVRKVTVSTGIMSTIAGTGDGSSTSGSYSGDNGPATSAGLYRPTGVCLDSSGNVYIADEYNYRVRKVTISTGIITTIAGSGSTTATTVGDGGPATSARLYNPTGVVLDSAGNVYIGDWSSNRVRKVTISTGIITTFAGNGGTGSYSGDNGAATAADLYGPFGVALDSSGNVYFAEWFNHRIRKVTISTSSPSYTPTVIPTTATPSLVPSTVPTYPPTSSPSVGIITTVAGTGTASYSGDNGAATSATLNNPMGVTLDSSGNIYIADRMNHRIRKVTAATGIITTIAGTGTSSYSGDNGQATSATLNGPTGATLDSAGNIYITDTFNNRVRKVTASIITLFAGTGSASFSGDNGPATSATLYSPGGVAVDASGNVYIADFLNNRIRKVTVSTGIITTIAGTGTGSYSGDNGPATSAALSGLAGVALDSTGNVYIADEYNSRIRKVTISTGIITTIAGSGSTTASSIGDGGPATSARLYNPTGVVLDSAGNVYIADWVSNRVRKVTISTGIITTFAGTGTSSYSGDNGAATAAELYHPYGVSLDSSGNVYIADWYNHRIRKVFVSSSSPSYTPTVIPTTATPSSSPSIGIITTIAGTGSSSYSGDNGPATSAALLYPAEARLDTAGNIYIADTHNHRIRKVTVSTGIITTFAGSSTSGGYSGDGGAATSAGLFGPADVEFDSAGNVYISDTYNHRIRKVTVSTGIITTIAGTGTSSYAGDGGAATSAALYGPWGLAFDATGNLYIGDRYNHRVRKVTVSSGIITTIAGSSTGGSYSGDNGPATSAVLNQPLGVTLDTAGNVYIADYNNHRIRKVTVSAGIITTFAGTGSGGYSSDNGPATSAMLNSPVGISLDSAGNLYIADAGNNRIRKVTASTGIITTVAGIGTGSYSGDGGQATAAAMFSPHGVSLDSAGNVYIADCFTHRIRKVVTGAATYSPSPQPSTATPSMTPSAAVATVDIITTVAGTGITSYSGDNGAATSASLYYPTAVRSDSAGNLYIADQYNHRIRKVTASTGIITTIAGSSTSGSYSGDNGLATAASLNNPTDISFDSSGNVYIADTTSNRVRKVTVSTGIITTYAGTGTGSYSGDNGQATSAALYNPWGLAFDSGNLYIGDRYNHRIRKVMVSTGIITTIAGNGGTTGSYSGDNGPATAAGLSEPLLVALDTAGNVYIADWSNSRIRKVTVSTGIITTIAGTGTQSYSGDGGAATSATLNYPVGVSLDAAGNVFIGDRNNHRVRKVTVSTGIITTVAGTGSATYSGDNGQATAATLQYPHGVALDSAGASMYIADTFNHRIRKVTLSVSPSPQPSTATPSMTPSASVITVDIITTIVGSGTQGFSGDNGQATAAALYYPSIARFDTAGNIYIADHYNNRVRKVTVSTGVITTIAGSSTIGSYSGDGAQATSATLYYPTDISLDSTGNVYIADYYNHRIRKVTVSTGIITTIAGIGTSSYSGDNGQATNAALNGPWGLALDSSGNVYIGDRSNHRIRKVTVSTGIITTYAGTGTGSYSGDNGQATSAGLNNPLGVALDSAGNVYIADEYNHRVRKVTVSTGIIATIAGSSTSGSYSGDNGPATSARMNNPVGIALDSAGNVFITDTSNNRIRKVTVSTGIITTYAGSGGTGSYSGDVVEATSAALYNPHGVSLDSAGNVYIADTFNQRIRKVVTVAATYAPSPPPSMTPSAAVATVDIITTAVGTGTGSYSGDNGQATSAGLDYPVGVRLDSAGNVYIADAGTNRVRKVTASTGIITTIAGTGASSYSGDNGQATSAALHYTADVSLDSTGNVYITDSNNHRIRKVTVSTGIITTIVGTGSATYSGDGGAATSAALSYPWGLTLDSAGNVYIGDRYNHRIRKVTVSTGIITTIAGTGSTTYSGDNGQATSAGLVEPLGVALDASGNVYFAEYSNHRIRKVTVSTGIITTFAGTGTGSYSGDNGPVTSAALNYPIGVSLDSAGNVFIADSHNQRIRKVTVSSGIITTIAGTGTTGFSGDNGLATSADLYYSHGVALDSTGASVYIADTSNNRIRKVTSSVSPSPQPSTAPPSMTPSAAVITVDIITTIVGSGTQGFSGDNGQATAGTLNNPCGVALDTSGNIYIADYSNSRIRKVTISTGIITTIAGTSSAGYSGNNGPATSAGLFAPRGVSLDSSGNVYIADTYNNCVRKVTISTGIITTIAGTGSSISGFSGDNGPATSATFYEPNGVTIDVADNVYIADSDNNRIRKVTVSTGIITTYAGTGTGSYSGDNGPASSATLNRPWTVAQDASGNIYISDYNNQRIRKVTISTGIITSVVGSSTSGSYSGDNGPATAAGLSGPLVVALDTSGNIYIADHFNYRIRKVTVSTGIITTIAGTGTGSYSGDGGEATAAAMNGPYGLAVDASSNVYIADTFNFRIRKVVTVPATSAPSPQPSTAPPSSSPSSAVITTLAGTGSTSFSGDTGPATSAALYCPVGVVLDVAGNMYIADTFNWRIRKVTISTGIITTIAGISTLGYSGDNGQATAATLYDPCGIAVDASGNVYIGDNGNHRIRKVTVSTGIITTIAGTGSSGYSGDNGPATSANLYYPVGVALDSTGNVYIADNNNYRIRKVTISSGIITTIAGTGSASYSGDGGAATAAALNNPIWVKLDATDNVYIADQNNNRIRKVMVSTGIITTIAGSSTSGSYSGDDGPATAATLYYPIGLSLDISGNVYIADQLNHRIRKVTVSTGIITTIAGNGVTLYNGDNIDALSAALYGPHGLDTDSSGNVYIADRFNNRIRKVTIPTTSPSFSPSPPPSMTPSAAVITVDIITTVAGTGTASYSGDNGQATSAGLDYPAEARFDAAGNLYIVDCVNQRIRKVTASTGIITTVAGSGGTGYSGDNGPATSAELWNPADMEFDSAGNMYIADTFNNRVRKVTISTGIMTTIAGTGTGSYSGDIGAATAAALWNPWGLALDSSGNVFIGDRYNHRVRLVTVSTGIITTYAGTGTGSYSGDNGPATSAGLYQPLGITLDSAGNVYIADEYNQRIRKVTASTGIITSLAGSGGTGSYSGDNGPATAAGLYYPADVTLDSAGNYYIADMFNHRVRKVTVSTGIITTYAGSGGTGSYSGDNSYATAAGLYYPVGVSLDAVGNVYIADCYNHRIRKVATVVATAAPSPPPSMTPTVDIITTVAGTGTASYSGDGGAATSAGLTNPTGVALDSLGNIYIADLGNYRIRKVTVSTGIITTYAGSGTAGYSGDNGQATSASLGNPWGLALDSTGNVYINEFSNHRIRKVTVSTGIIITIAGTGTSSYSGDNGPATAAEIAAPLGSAVDAAGNVYIGDYGNYRVRKVTVSTGIITTLAGNGIGSYSGDNGPATSASLFAPTGVASDSTGNVYIADEYNSRIRKVTVSTGIITTIAGSGSTTTTSVGDGGPATAGRLYNPTGVVLDSAGDIYIADWISNRVRKVTISTGIITTLAGSGGTGSYSGDFGAATAAELYYPYGVALDSSGNVYIAEWYNHRIRKVAVGTTNYPSALPSTQQPSVTPTTAPTSMPSVVPSTMSPSVVPSLAPSAYPTYSSSVRVYFTVTQGLTGTSASTYSNSKVSNDALFKQTVASMLGYDSRKEDVSIQLVTDTVQSRRSLSTATAVQVCEVMYSITTPTFIFNDTNHATAMFIQALNESIATGTFDLVLHANSGSTSSWQSTTTDYVIFSTASPTSSPTSTPTSAPTKRDNVAVNLLAVPLDDKVAKAKVKYYLGTFMGYFLAIYICLYLYSFLRHGKLTASRLYDSSYQSELHVRNSAVTSGGVEILSDLILKNGLVQSNMKLQDELMAVKQSSSRKLVDATGEESKYSKGYREYMHQQRVLLGCSPFLYPEGYVVKIPCVSRELVFPPGRMEDIMLYICHNHPLFSCFYFMDGSKLGAHGTRILYIGKDVAVFVLYQFSNMLLQYFLLDGYGLGTLINLFVITPSAVSVGLLLKYLYTCPFTETVEFQRKYAKYHLTVMFLGRLAILPIMVIMFSSLIIACLFSSNRDTLGILINYFIFVQFYGILFAIAKALLLFRDNYYYQLTLFGVLDVLCIGRLYKERILAEQLVVDVDYAYRINTYLFGLIKVQKILNRDDAIKAKWITVRGEGETVCLDTEMTSVVTGSDDAAVVQHNPLLEYDEVTSRSSLAISMDAIYDTKSIDEEVGYAYTDVANPIHSLAAATDDSHATFIVHQPLRLQQSAINESSEDASALDDDAALYLEYQSLQDSHNDAVYDLNENTEISFEEWKSRRKQFKQGTRGSFVKAFQVFEEREQAARDLLEQSASMQNTMKLHRFNAKNALATTNKGGPASRPKL